jgi:hypothetical protein
MRPLPAILCLAAAAPPVDAQPIRVDVNLVNVAFSVHDAHGKLSGDLAAEPNRRTPLGWRSQEW